MIYLESITSIFIFVIMACMSAISTAYLSISEKDFNFDEIKDKKKVKNIKLFLKESSSFILSIEFVIAFLDLWLGALIVEIIASPVYKDLKLTFQGTEYIVKYIIILLTVIIFSYLFYVLAKIIPKTIAIKNKKKIVLLTANFIHIISIIFKPIAYFLKSTENVIMRIFNVERKEKISYKDSEIRGIVQAKTEMGTLTKKESMIISNYLKLDEMTAKDAMINIENVISVDLTASDEEIDKIILQYGYTRIPVYDGEKTNIVGILNIKNLMQDMIKNKDIEVKKHIKPCMIVSSGKRLDLLFNEMKNNKEHMVIVMKEKNIAIGIVTMEDIIEEIAGNIEDDYEKYNKTKKR